MAKATYAKKFRFICAFCVLIKKKGCDLNAVSFPFICYCVLSTLYSDLR